MTTSIEWAQNPDGTPGETWNPTRGCDKVSPGCKHCYAETFAERWRGVKGHPYEQGFDFRLVPDALDRPLRRRKPTTYFVNSMSDLLHKETPNEYIAAVFGVMAACPQHRFIVLTKRAERLPEWFAWMQPHRPSETQSIMHESVKRYMGYDNPRRPAVNEHRWPLPNVWVGVSVEDQQRANERIPYLLQVPAAVRFLSCEPLLGPVELDATPGGDVISECDCGGRGCDACMGLPRLDWVIVGGESGPGARPMRIEWARDLVNQCRDAGVPVFFKQTGVAPQMAEDLWRAGPRTPLLNHRAHGKVPEGLVQLAVPDKHGGIPEAWPGGADAWPREFPEVRNG